MSEERQLRRALRDMVALTMLPSVWTGYDARQICHDVVRLLARIGDLDGVFLSARGTASTEILELRRPDDDELGRILRASASTPLASESRVPASRGEVRLLSYPLSPASDERLLAAAYRDDFPTESERLLLRVAANQAAVWIQRKKAEAGLAAESAFRRGIESSMRAGVAVIDTQGKQIYVNPAFAEMVGWSHSELLGAEPPFVYWPPEELEAIHAALQEVISGDARESGYELRFRRRNEERFDVLVLISPLRGGEALTGFLAVIYDITERKQAERATRFLAQASDVLSRSLDYEETLRAVSAIVVPHFADWCFIDLVDPDGAFHRVAVAHARPEHAPLAARLQRSYEPKETPYGVTQTYLRGTTQMMNDVTPDVLLGVARDEDHRDVLLALGIRCFVSVPMKSRDATFGVMTFLGTETRTRFARSDVALAEELAHRVAVAVENARLYRNAQAANRAKDEFLANLSHELRTPMTAILGWTYLLERGDLDAGEVRVGLETIRQSAEAQARLIDELLDVSRIVTGKLRMEQDVVDLRAVLDAAVCAIRPAAAAKRQVLDIDGRAADTCVLGDAARLQQVFWNLLSNAVKFTPAGGTIGVAIEEEGVAHLRVTVRDDGEGIPQWFLPLVFERFRQAATPVHGRTGLGLGLAIARELVEMHGGAIEAASEGPNRGSTFIVTLPRLTQDGRIADPASAGAAR